MIIKWIRCEIASGMQHAFSCAQKSWSDLANVEGFIAQVGGWDCSSINRAGILALWRDMPAYEAFMARRHDEILSDNGQEQTCSTVDVRVYEVIGPCSAFEIVSALSATKMLSCTLFQYPIDGDQRFVRSQLDRSATARDSTVLSGRKILQPVVGISEYLVVVSGRHETRPAANTTNHFKPIDEWKVFRKQPDSFAVTRYPGPHIRRFIGRVLSEPLTLDSSCAVGTSNKASLHH